MIKTSQNQALLGLLSAHVTEGDNISIVKSNSLVCFRISWQYGQTVVVWLTMKQNKTVDFVQERNGSC